MTTTRKASTAAPAPALAFAAAALALLAAACGGGPAGGAQAPQEAEEAAAAPAPSSAPAPTPGPAPSSAPSPSTAEPAPRPDPDPDPDPEPDPELEPDPDPDAYPALTEEEWEAEQIADADDWWEQTVARGLELDAQTPPPPAPELDPEPEPETEVDPELAGVPSLTGAEAVAQGGVPEPESRARDDREVGAYDEYDPGPGPSLLPPPFEELQQAEGVLDWDAVEDPAGGVDSGGNQMRVTAPLTITQGLAFRWQTGFGVVSRPPEEKPNGEWRIYICSRYGGDLFGDEAPPPDQEFVHVSWRLPDGRFKMRMDNSLWSGHACPDRGAQ